MDFMNKFFMVGVIFFFALFIKNIFSWAFHLGYEGTHKRRFKELNYDGTRIGQSQDDETKEFLNNLARPVLKYVLPLFEKKDDEKLQQDLEFTGWNKYMDAEQFRAISIILKIVGIVAAIALWTTAIPLAVIWGGLLIFGMDFFLSNSVKNKKEVMFSGFPDFIRLVQGYLAAEMPLTNAIENTIEFVSDDWKPYLKDFVINSRTRSTSDALNTMRNEIDIFEVKELLSLIRLSIESGIDVQKSFENQNEKVRNMQLAVMMSKIEKRKMMATIIQAPLLLTIIIALGLPTLESMLNIGSM